MRQRPQDKADSEFRNGVIAGFLVHLAGIAVLLPVAVLLDNAAALFMIFGFGVVQLVYFIPTLIVVKRKEATRDFIKGLAMTAIIPFVLNAGCFGFIGLGSMQ